MLSKEGGDKAVLTGERCRACSLAPVTAERQRGRNGQLGVVTRKD